MSLFDDLPELGGTVATAPPSRRPASPPRLRAAARTDGSAARPNGSAARSAPPGSEAADGYTAEDLRALGDLEHIRMRPAMYIGGTDVQGLTHCLIELIDNSADEALAGHANHIKIALYPDGSAEVQDDGRGIPVDIEPSTGMSGLVLVLSKTNAGGKFDDRVYGASGGLHGVGAKATNALAEQLEAEVFRHGYSYTVRFERGQLTQDLQRTKAPKGSRGTRIRFWPDPVIFGDLKFDLDLLVARVRPKPYLIPGLHIEVQDLRDPDNPRAETYHTDRGLQEYLNSLGGHSLCHTIMVDRLISYETTALSADTRQVEQITRNMRVQAALRWTTGYDPHIVSFVNLVPTPQGGTHYRGFVDGLARTMVEAATDFKVKLAKDPDISREDMLEGLQAVINLRMPEPQFQGQTKDSLSSPEATAAVRAATSDILTEWLSRPANRAQAKAVLGKMLEAAKSRAAAKVARQEQRDLSRIGSGSLPAKLRDCRHHAPADSELLVLEGDSALVPAKRGRDGGFQALLPLRGIIINSLTSPNAKVLANEEVKAIFSSLGIVPGQLDLTGLRYQRFISMTDADADGYHIRCLLLTLLYRWARPLLDAGMVYIAQPPLYTVRVKGQPDQHFFTEEEFAAAKVPANAHVNRFKGLGEMNADQLRTACLDPATRQLVQVTMHDVEMAIQMFNTLFGDDANARWEFIQQHAPELAEGQLDLGD